MRFLEDDEVDRNSERRESVSASIESSKAELKEEDGKNMDHSNNERAYLAARDEDAIDVEQLEGEEAGKEESGMELTGDGTIEEIGDDGSSTTGERVSKSESCCWMRGSSSPCIASSMGTAGAT